MLDRACLVLTLLAVRFMDQRLLFAQKTSAIL